MMPVEPSSYFSERHGRRPARRPVDYETLRRLVINVFHSFRERAYFQQAFGYECVDGDRAGTVGADPDAYFLRTIGRDHIWPYWHTDPQAPVLLRKSWAEQWDADTLFDVVEVLHDLVAKPTRGRVHTFAECGYHASHFDAGEGRREYRRAINEVLQLHDPPYEFDDVGRLTERVPDEFRPLIDAEVPEGTDHDAITEKVESATRLFRARSSSTNDRAHAVRDLADVLEALREDMKSVMLATDERALFDLANNFAIRHNNRSQRRGYDREVWLRWAFYVYLATVHAVLRVRDREAR